MKTVLITGCSSGFGLEIARYFLAATGKSSRRCARRAPMCCAFRALAACWRLDVTDPESIRRAVEAAGPIDVLVNNAGSARLPRRNWSDGEVREIFETNTFGTIALMRRCCPSFGSVKPASSGMSRRALR